MKTPKWVVTDVKPKTDYTLLINIYRRRAKAVQCPTAVRKNYLCTAEKHQLFYVCKAVLRHCCME